MNSKRYLLGLVLASFLGGMMAIGGYHIINGDEKTMQMLPSENQGVRFSNASNYSNAGLPVEMNFVDAAKIVTPGVVHIKSTIKNAQAVQNFSPFDQYFKEFFGDPRGGRNFEQQPSVGTGSGVIISTDGYIATNNHVVENATEVEILLNDNSTYKATVVGTDPTTDLALLKIEAKNLPAVKIGNSDDVEVGEWVLAVGNPFEFRSTVTAGIISAKGRNINILRNRDNMAIESFLQTDAAVNPGNSGGALVNLRGELVGINTAIATPTGTFAGYSFAVPANLVNKVIGDLKEFGVVQRALLGINIRDVNSQLSEQEHLEVLEGVYVEGVNQNSGGEEAGLKKGDVIIAINGQKVKKTAELQEKIALNRPGDKVLVSFLREGKEKSVTATLKNTLGTTEVVGAMNNSVMIQGAKFEDVSAKLAERLRIEGGAKLVVLDKGKWSDAGIKEGFIVTSIDHIPVKSVEDLTRALNKTRNGAGMLIAGIYENGLKAYYGIGS